MDHVMIYTDGACSGNPGPGGWGVILETGAHRKELSGFEPDTTNNRMELMAAIEGLSALRRPCRVDLYSDSSYLVNAFEQNWLKNWQARGWRKADKSPVINQDLWMRLLELTKTHDVTFKKVKGHADDPRNERCDELARMAIKENKPRI